MERIRARDETSAPFTGEAARARAVVPIDGVPAGRRVLLDDGRRLA